jgi:hypothetical protein
MSEKEQDFETLKQLLKLKQHEVPPPGYFNGFSDQVISRIRAGEAGGAKTFIEQLETTSPWLVNFLRIFETRPGVIGAFATSLCILLVLTVVFAERSDEASKAVFSLTDPTATDTSGSVAKVSEPPLLAASESSGIAVSTNPLASLQPTTTLFGQPANSGLFQSASFAPAGQ